MGSAKKALYQTGLVKNLLTLELNVIISRKLYHVLKIDKKKEADNLTIINKENCLETYSSLVQLKKCFLFHSR